MEHANAMTPVDGALAAPSPGAASASRVVAVTHVLPRSRIILGVGALSLLATFVAPLWSIALKAPQYPEGLKMYIWSNRITGSLDSINGLNHYIGMRQILPEAIAELRLMPGVVITLAVLGVLAAAWGRRIALFAWTGIALTASLVGLVDFYRWGYTYGHNLDPTAAIKIPGMSYQPPLIGSKVLLNFQAVSWPALAGWIAILAITTVTVTSIAEYRRGRT